jgi:mannose-6-phosphate isomerase
LTIEHAHAHPLPKPWGVVDLRPWSNAGDNANTIGEIWYERTSSTATPPSLLLKLLLTSQPLSIQVHPDDAYAQSIGLLNGKTEAWYVLSAAPEAKVALGLKRRVSPEQLRHAIDDGSISDLVVWQAAHPGERL